MQTNLDKIFPGEKPSNEGVWTSLPTAPAIKLKLAFAGNANRKWKSLSIELAMKIGAFSEDSFSVKDLTPEQLKEFAKENISMAAKAIVKDWKGIEDINGGAVPCNETTATQLLEKHPDFQLFVSTFSQDPKNFKGNSSEELKKK